ncbi:MAG: HEPN domain-containing protein [Elusimicrobia bacterium]|nr:HEPN domain-containing protein [Elusimicrobiota bacterium]MBP9127399.1 HEPN domain-containing protein [Elusimicrobiota bacterium]MBP9698805.1 HEPN domain-containing protein [Elusimicrobiota bacterium]
MSDDLLREWADKAEQDYDAALILFKERKRSLCDIVCFHSQQCAEKYWKAFLVSCKKPFFKTHDLAELRESVVRLDGTFALIGDLLKTLNPYSVDVRYPGDEADRKEAGRAIKAMKEVRAFVRGKLKGRI